MDLIATIPAPPLRNIELGPLTLHGYGLVMGLAIVVAMYVAEWGLRRQAVHTTRFTTWAIVAVLGGFVGARLYHVLSEPLRYAHHPADIPAIWNGGLGIYGGVAGGAIAGLWFAPHCGIPRAAICDAIAPALLAAQAIGRWGNYLNQELFGRPLDAPWALEVDRAARPSRYLEHATFHPTFLYESIANLLLACVFALLVVRWTRRAPGVLFPLYIAAYSVVRVLVEPLRIDDAHELWGVRQNTWVAGGLLLAGLAGAAYVTMRARRSERASSTSITS